MTRSLRSWIWRIPLEQEVDEELGFHLDMLTRELVDQGMAPAAARETAVARLGNLARLRRRCLDSGRKRDRRMRIALWFEEFRQDVSFAVRQLRGSPTFAAVAVLTLALGIGANSAIFALVDAVLLRPLPLPQPDRLVMVWERNISSDRERVAPPNLLDWNDSNRSFEVVAGFAPGVGGMVMAGADGTAETVSRQWVTARFFDAVGIRPLAGRTFLQDDDNARSNVAVLSEAFWRSRYGADPAAIGRVVALDGMPFTIVGVVPASFQQFGRTSIWALMPLDRRPALRAAHFLQSVGRLKPGVGIDAATADLQAIATKLATEFPATNAGRGIAVEPLRQALIGGDLRVTSMLFLGVVGFVLLICCANVANLLLARATARTGEMAIRSALGAGRSRVVRQLLTESLVLSAIGGVLGIGIGAFALDVAASLIPRGLLPPAVAPTFDLRVAVFCAAAALAGGVLFGLAPAWQTSADTAAHAIASQSRSVTGGGGRLRRLLVGAEVATAVLLLFGAGLLMRTLIAVRGVDRGYRAGEVLTMMVDPLGSEYPTAASLAQFFDAVEQEIRALPAVGQVAWTNALPLGASDALPYSFEIEGDAPIEAARRPVADYQVASRSYFDTLDLPILSGRAFDDRDTTTGLPVCIVNEAFVRGYLQGRSPIGARVAFRPADSPQAAPVLREVVGISRQVKARPDERQEAVQVYVPLMQAPTDDIYLLVRPASGRASNQAAAVRAAIGRVDRAQLVSIRDVMTLDDVAREATDRHRFRATTVATFAALALLLALVGVFGILAYAVEEQERELAVRRALGATTADVIRGVAGSAARVILAGALAGLVLSAVFGRLIAALLFGVEPLDFTTFAGVALITAAAGTLAAAAPAWRASQIDPAVTLRT